MDPIWITAIGLLVPFVQKTGEKFAEAAGKAIFDSLMKRFQRDNDGQGRKILSEYKKDPDLYDETLEKYLKRRAQDKEFREWLEGQIADAQKRSDQNEPARTHIESNIQVRDNATVGMIIGGQAGDINQNRMPKTRKTNKRR